jgi:ATP-dependent DNA helicase 2 subunit 2
LSEEEAYHNIMVLLPIQQYEQSLYITPNDARILMPQIGALKTLLTVQKTNKGDSIPRSRRRLRLAMSALIVGLDLIMKYCRHLKYIKNIILITDGRGVTDWSQVDDIAEQINREHIKLSILLPPTTAHPNSRGIDFDDPEYGFKEEDKSVTKVHHPETSKKHRASNS